MQPKNPGEAFCLTVSQRNDIPNPIARIGAWIVGAASLTGGFPLEVTFREIHSGFLRNGVRVEGTGCHLSTVARALVWLEECKIIRVESGKPSGFGHHARIIHWELK